MTVVSVQVRGPVFEAVTFCGARVFDVTVVVTGALAQPFVVTTSVYVPAAVVVKVCALEANAFGPRQAKVEPFKLELPDTVAEAAQVTTPPNAEATGTGLTVTAVVAVAEHPCAEVTVTEY